MDYNIQKYVIRVTENNERDIVIESNKEYPEILDNVISLVENDDQFFNSEKVVRDINYVNVTHEYKENLSQKEFYELKPDHYLYEEYTVRARQYAQSICELFEEILDKHNITIPDPDRNSQGEDEEAARIYGETYFNLEDDITNVITEMVNRVKRDEIEVISDTY